MNTKAIMLAVLAVLVAGLARADSFQFVREATGAYISLAPVYIDDSLIGSTDQYGRIAIHKPPGQYHISIRLREGTVEKMIFISGDNTIKVVHF